MKEFVARNKLYVFMIVLFAVFGFLSIIPLNKYKSTKEYVVNYYNDLSLKCNNDKYENLTEQEKFDCEFSLKYFNETDYNLTAYDGYYMYVFDFFREFLNEFIIVLIIIVVNAYFVTKYLRNRIIINNINRESYKRIKKELFFSSWKYSLLVPIMLTIVFTLTMIITGNGDNGYPYLENTIFENNIMLYFFFIFIQAFILNLIYANITLIISRKEHNYIISVIKSFVCVAAISLFIEIVNNNIIFGLFKASKGIDFNILNMYDLIDETNIFYNMIWNLIMLAISFVILFVSYRNKEKLIIDSEKNDNKNEE